MATPSVHILKPTETAAQRYVVLGHPCQVEMDAAEKVPALSAGPYNVRFYCDAHNFAVALISPTDKEGAGDSGKEAQKMVRFNDKGEPTSLPNSTREELRSQMDELGWALCTIAKTDPILQDFIRAKQLKDAKLD